MSRPVYKAENKRSAVAMWMVRKKNVVFSAPTFLQAEARMTLSTSNSPFRLGNQHVHRLDGTRLKNIRRRSKDRTLVNYKEPFHSLPHFRGYHPRCHFSRSNLSLETLYLVARQLRQR